LTGPSRFFTPIVFACCLFGWTAEARADWLVTPFLGTTFGAETTLLDFGGGTEVKHWAFGASGALLTDQVFGLEADLSWVPGFFEGKDPQDLVSGSRLTTMFGNVIAAVPLAVSRESLRPYLVGGLGLLHVKPNDIVDLSEGRNSLGLQLGGGALGLITERTGVRFDLRQTRTLGRAPNDLTGVSGTKVSFWRATIGVIFRY
jgi:Outer membrane protein beta-barrel domain